MSKKDEIAIAIAEVYPNLSAEEQENVRQNLIEYLGVVKRIFERVSEQDPELLTQLQSRANLRKKKEEA